MTVSQQQKWSQHNNVLSGLNITEQFSHLWSGWGAGRVWELSVQSFSRSYLFWLGLLSLELKSQHSVIHVAYNMLSLYWLLKQREMWLKKKKRYTSFQDRDRGVMNYSAASQFLLQRERGEKIWDSPICSTMSGGKTLEAKARRKMSENSLSRPPIPMRSKFQSGLMMDCREPLAFDFPGEGLSKSGCWGTLKKFRKTSYLYFIHQGHTLCQINWCIKHLSRDDKVRKPCVFWLPSSGTFWLLHYLSLNCSLSHWTTQATELK